MINYLNLDSLYKVKGKLPFEKQLGSKGIFSRERGELFANWIFHLDFQSQMNY